MKARCGGDRRWQRRGDQRPDPAPSPLAFARRRDSGTDSAPPSGGRSIEEMEVAEAEARASVDGGAPPDAASASGRRSATIQARMDPIL